jgi:hypothetical protein
VGIDLIGRHAVNVVPDGCLDRKGRAQFRHWLTLQLVDVGPQLIG